MTKMLELAFLLLLMTLAHNTVVGSRRMMKDTIAGFVIWSFMFGAAIALIMVPPVLAALVRILFWAGGAYAIWWLARHLLWLAVRLQRLPPPVGNEDVLTLYRYRTGSRYEDAVREVTGLLREFEPEAVALALITGKGEFPSGEEVAEHCTDQAERVTRVVGRYQKASESRSHKDASLIARLMVRYRPGDVERAVKWLEAQGPGVSAGPFARVRARSLLISRLCREGDPGPFLDLLQDAGRATCVSWGEIAREVSPGRLALALAFPPYAYALFGDTRRAVTFGLVYGLLIGYAVFALNTGNTAGWVFLAVAALAHLSAGFSLQDFVLAGREEQAEGSRRS